MFVIPCNASGFEYSVQVGDVLRYTLATVRLGPEHAHWNPGDIIQTGDTFVLNVTAVDPETGVTFWLTLEDPQGNPKNYSRFDLSSPNIIHAWYCIVIPLNFTHVRNNLEETEHTVVETPTLIRANKTRNDSWYTPNQSVIERYHERAEWRKNDGFALWAETEWDEGDLWRIELITDGSTATPLEFIPVLMGMLVSVFFVNMIKKIHQRRLQIISKKM